MHEQVNLTHGRLRPNETLLGCDCERCARVARAWPATARAVPAGTNGRPAPAPESAAARRARLARSLLSAGRPGPVPAQPDARRQRLARKILDAGRAGGGKP